MRNSQLQRCEGISLSAEKVLAFQLLDDLADDEAEHGEDQLVAEHGRREGSRRELRNRESTAEQRAEKKAGADDGQAVEVVVVAVRDGLVDAAEAHREDDSGNSSEENDGEGIESEDTESMNNVHCISPKLE